MSAVAGRRTYTEDELQAALRDIQSGKLGTRRAAVIYGIPRSTLRNKVYKLALERERESHLNSSSTLKLDEEEVMDDDKELSGAEEEKEVEKALQAPLLSMADLFRFTGRDQVNIISLRFLKWTVYKLYYYLFIVAPFGFNNLAHIFLNYCRSIFSPVAKGRNVNKGY